MNDKAEADMFEGMVAANHQRLQLLEGERKRAEVEGDKQRMHLIEVSLSEVHQELADLSQKRKKFGSSYEPAIIIDAIRDILKDNRINSVFDPFARDGVLLSSLLASGIGSRGRGICLSPPDCYFAKAYSEKLPIEWELANPFQVLSSIREKFDLVVSNPPFGLKGHDSPQYFPQFSDIRATDDELLLLAASLHLTDTGIGIFIVDSGFPNRPCGVLSNLNRFGLMLDAYLELPEKVFMPFTNVSAGIVLIRKSLQTPVFTGLISADPIQRKSLIRNYFKRTAANDVTLGALVEFKEFRGFAPLQVQDRINRINKKFGYPSHPLKDLIISFNTIRKDQEIVEKGNSIFVPPVGMREVTTSFSEIRNPQGYFHIQLNPDLADAEYIAGHLSSQLGRSLLEYGATGSVLPRLSRASFDYISVYLPPLDVQKQLAHANRQVKQIEADLTTIKDQLWTEPRQITTIKTKLDRITREDSFKDWIDTLPFPLATILWAYNTAGKDDKLRSEYLLNFFEAAAEFYATILLSAAKADCDLWKSKVPEIHEGLSSHHLSFIHSSFGTWSNTYGILAKEIRRMKAAPESPERVYQMLKTHDPEVVAGLCAKELVSLFQETNRLRNIWKGHTGIVGVTAAKERLEILDPHLQTFRKITGSTWNHYFMIKAGGLDCYSDDRFQQQISMMRGSNTPFVPDERELNKPLQKDSLYLIGDGEREALKLLPLIRLASSPEWETNAVYFFNKKEADGYRYVSYHFEREADVEFPSSDLLKALNGLMEPPPNSLRCD